MKKILQWFKPKPKPKQAEFNCTCCGRYYRFKHFVNSHERKSIFCKCNEIMTVYINDNAVTNISIF